MFAKRAKKVHNEPYFNNFIYIYLNTKLQFANTNYSSYN